MATTEMKKPRKPGATECREHFIGFRVTTSTLQKLDAIAQTAGTSRADVFAALIATAPQTLGAATP